jgi:hypothetical protein
MSTIDWVLELFPTGGRRSGSYDLGNPWTEAANRVRPQQSGRRELAASAPIAELAGEDWPKKAREAGERLTRTRRQPSDGLQLLAAFKEIFASRRKEITSAAVVEHLTADPTSLWVEYNGRGAITHRQIAYLLDAYDIDPLVLHPRKRANSSPRGYKAAQYVDALARYLPADPHIRTQLRHARRAMFPAATGAEAIMRTGRLATSGFAKDVAAPREMNLQRDHPQGGSHESEMEEETPHAAPGSSSRSPHLTAVVATCPQQPFAFGYAITCHNSQGSQWDSVLVFDESKVFRQDRCGWLYTAITRAADRVVVAK